MLKVKQRPATELTPPAAGDIETGVTINTDIAGDELDPPLTHPPTVVAIPAVHDDLRPGVAADCQLPPEQAQHFRAPRIAVLRDTTNQSSV